jgi:hypothetical protein
MMADGIDALMTQDELCSSANESRERETEESLAVTNDANDGISECQLDPLSPLPTQDISIVSTLLEQPTMAIQDEISLPIPDPEPPDTTINIEQNNGQDTLFKTAYNHNHGIIQRPYIHRNYHPSKSFHDDSLNDHENYYLHTERDNELVYQTPTKPIRLSDGNMTNDLRIPYDEKTIEIYSRFTHLNDYPISEADRQSRLYMSVTSNVFFFFGGFFCSLVAAYVIYDKNHTDTPYQQDDKIDTDFNPWSPGKYYIMGVLGPLFFVLNAGMDIYRSTRWKDPRELDPNFDFENETRWDIISATLFGIAAALHLLSSLVQGDDQGWQNDTYIISTHLYLLSAVASLIGLQFDASSTGDLLFAIGCMLFLIGSLIDTGLSYVISYGVESSQELFLYKWSLASAILWTVDAILYLMADFFFSEAPEMILTTAKDLGIPCTPECIDNNGAKYRNYKVEMI